MKKLLSIITTLALCLSMLPATALAADIISSGDCGDNVTWTLDSNGTLTISGTGPMFDFYAVGSVPWYYSDRTIVESVVIERGVTSVGPHAFGGCNSLTSVTIPDSVTSIGHGAFCGCSSLASIEIPDSVTSIGSSAFSWCSSLTSVAIPDGITSIGYETFGDCSSLISVTIPDSVTSIGDEAFRECSSLTSITIPDGVTGIGRGAFMDCSSLTSITIPDGVTSIGDQTFSGCDSLTSVTIPDSVTSIGDLAFGWCDSLTSITIPDSVTSIGNGAFYWSGLTSITIPGSVTSIGDGAFEGCTDLPGISVDPENPDYTSEDGVLFDKQKSILICYPAGKSNSSYTIPDSVTSIGGGAFYYSGLTSIIIPDIVTSIGVSAFEGCSSLTSITIPGSVTSIGNGAFLDCYSLTSITIPDSVTSIGDEAFESCDSLTSITIPDGVTGIGWYAFAWCSSLTSIAIPASVTSIRGSAFEDCSSLTDVYYAGSESQWKAIIIGEGNDPLLSATIHYNSTGPVDPVRTYTVTVNGGMGGGDYEPGEIVIIRAIVPNGQQFTGWIVEEGDVTLSDPGREVTTFIMPEGNVRVTATYKDIATPPAPAQTYTVTVNGGTGGGDYEIGEDVTITAIVSDGQRFTGWVVEEGDVTLADPYSEVTTFTMPAGDVTVTATCEEIVTPPTPARAYTVWINGGTGSGRYEAGETVTITAIVPDGQRFTGWAVDEGDVTLADPYSEVTTFTMPASDVTVTATCENVVIQPVSSAYTITFNANGGAVTPGTMTTDKEGKLAELPIPVRDGYTFDGWFTTPDGGKKITADWVFTEDTQVYAHWTYNSTSSPGEDTWYPFPDNTSAPPSTAPKTYPVTSPVVSGGEITISPANAKKGDTVTVTVTPDDGYELGKLTVTDSRGNELALTDAGDGRYTFIMPDSKVTVDAEFTAIEQQEPNPVWTNSFTDVDADAWYYDALKFVSENGLMNDLSADQFAPNANLSRAQLAQILYNKEGKPAVSGGSAFTDVNAGAWYSDAVTWAAANHIVGGYGNGAFGPDDNITREQLAVMLWRYAGEPASVRGISFGDADQISDFAQAAIRWAVENGILNGKGNNILDPRGFATRAEVAQMLKNYLDS